MESKTPCRGIGRRKQQAKKSVQKNTDLDDPDPKLLKAPRDEKKKTLRRPRDSDDEFIKGSSESDSESASDADARRAAYDNNQWEDSDDSDDSVMGPVPSVRRRLNLEEAKGDAEAGEGSGVEEDEENGDGGGVNPTIPDPDDDELHRQWPESRQGYYGGRTVFLRGPIGNIHYPIAHLSVTVTRNGQHIPVGW